MAIGGAGVAGGCSLLFRAGALQPEIYITLVGIGLFVANAPIGGVFFDRHIAATRTQGTSLFLVYMGDGRFEGEKGGGGGGRGARPQ